MEKTHNFTKTKNQYEYQPRKWRVKKKVPQEAWKYVSHQIKKREGKKTEITLFGIPVSAAKVRKETQRYAVPPRANEFGKRLPSPELPSGIVIRAQTPLIIKPDVSWPKVLPWFHFKNGLLPPPGFPGDLLIAFFTLGQYDEIHRVESIYSAWRNPRELHKLLLRLANMVLDDPEDRHEKAEALARNEFPPCMVMKMLKIIFFRLSNKLGEYGEYRNKASQCIHDKFVLHLVKAVSHSNPEMIKSLFSSRSATTKAIKEAVYGSAIREKNYE
ncbi:hypothetical protein F4824DRAFT_455817 [Ustulina deusta]|nr:hypothetical protein F4824DRAFT_455817 [Ustulina deusta]